MRTKVSVNQNVCFNFTFIYLFIFSHIIISITCCVRHKNNNNKMNNKHNNTISICLYCTDVNSLFSLSGLFCNRPSLFFVCFLLNSHTKINKTNKHTKNIPCGANLEQTVAKEKLYIFVLGRDIHFQPTISFLELWSEKNYFPLVLLVVVLG